MSSDFRQALNTLANCAPPEHNLWQGDILNASPAKVKFLKSVKERSLDGLNSDQWNTLMFSRAYTIGDSKSFEHLLPIFLEKVFSGEIEIVHFTSDQLLSKLNYVKYQTWAKSRIEAVDSLIKYYTNKENE